MFPCKVKIDQLDKTNTKVKDVDMKANKALTKGKIKKVVTKEGERTPFYYIGGYFEDKGKAIGDFLSFGDSPKLEKHFVQHEMKKSKNSTMDEKVQDPKKAAMGAMYVKESVIHFEPHEKSKIPPAKWPKILKEMKEYFLGMKAVVVIDGKVIEGEEDKSETSSAVVEEASAVDLNTDKTKQGIAKRFKNLRETYITVRDNEHDAKMVKGLYLNLKTWLEDFKQLDKGEQKELKAYYEKFATLLEGVKKIIKADQKIDEHLKSVTEAIAKYVATQDRSTGPAIALKKEALEELDGIMKFAKFVGASEMMSQCTIIKGLFD
jgi:hypothetical protein